MKRSSLRSNGGSPTTDATPATCVPKPRSRHASTRVMPLSVAQRDAHVVERIADARHDAHARDDDSLQAL
ncbi:hypothetical protein BZM27_10635 [Paraburkholderia steynii]|uniref:Uncharacterized protein n=1 Tax=Paraburkholderia steynii TaxID=1245441 RepID=A0A4R0XII8_9BURK|nr:hypothetical protein BZM27_10635 [Paraburkholderia steynii]